MSRREDALTAAFDRQRGGCWACDAPLHWRGSGNPLHYSPTVPPILVCCSHWEEIRGDMPPCQCEDEDQEGSSVPPPLRDLRPIA